MVSLISNYLKGSRRNPNKPKFGLKVKIGENIWNIILARQILSYEDMEVFSHSTHSGNAEIKNRISFYRNDT